MNSDWTKLERHPFSEEYRDITGIDWTRFVNKFKSLGFLADRPIILYEGKILDGWQRQRACVELNIVPNFSVLQEGIDPRSFVEAMNDERRHETPEEREARRQRVAQARSEGKSLRTIAETENVSEKTVRNDLKKPSGAEGYAPEKVTGKDGKEYNAKVTQPQFPEEYEEAPDFDQPQFHPEPSTNGKPTQTTKTAKKTATSRTAQDAAPDDDDGEMVDDADFPVPARLRQIFAVKPMFRSIAYRFSQLSTSVKQAVATEAYRLSVRLLKERYRWDNVVIGGSEIFRDIEPSHVHQPCNAAGCKDCGNKGYLTVGEVKDGAPSDINF